MMRTTLVRSLGLAAALGAATSSAQAQFNISGVTDKAAPYVNTVTFTVGTQPGYSYGIFLNQQRIPTDVPVTLNTPDFYELNAYATNVATSVVTSRWVRFIVRSSERAGTEWGLPPHVPSPVIPSAAAEFAGAQLRLLVPQDFPTGYEIPVVAWVVTTGSQVVRANGSLAAAGHPSINIKRGVGSGFLAANNPAGTLNYTPGIKGVQTNQPINLDASTTWTTVSGTLSGTTTWPDNSRIRVTGHIGIPAGSTLTVGAGAIVQLNPGVNITNNGSVQINGTVDQPVVFMPQTRAQPWGGFFMRTSTGVLNATGTIFTGSGADPNGGAGHRSEQCLFLVDSTPRITLTDCAAIYLAGQFGHAYNGGTFNFTRFLLQRATTGGEYTGASFTVNDSAFIEFPDDTANFVDGDNDALYFVSGSHAFTNTLFGWTKDDGIDSGGSGYGPLTYQSCWFESTFHEGNSLSGYKNVLSRDTVYMDCGQGIENGYDGPTNRMDHCLFLANKVGLRHGDNYDNIGSYNGRESAANTLSLYNHRDVFGFNWRSGTGNGWTNATGQMTIISNWLSAPNVYFPSNNIWNPETDAALLSPFMTTPPQAAVGVGFAVRTNLFPLSALTDGIPIRLSSFTTNVVQVHYGFDDDDPNDFGGGSGTVVFQPGETFKRIYPSVFDPTLAAPWNVYLLDAVGGEITGVASVRYEGTTTIPQVSLAVSTNLLPGYRLGEGTFVRLSAPTIQPAHVSYGIFAGGTAIGSGVLTFMPPEMTKQIFVTGVNPFDYPAVEVRLSNPVFATLGTSSVTYTNPALAVSFGVVGNQANLALLGTGLPVGLNSPAPSGVSVQFRIENSNGVLTNGTIVFAGGELSKNLVTPTIDLQQATLLRATLFGSTGATLGAPATVYLVRTVAPPPATNTTLIARGARWRYRDVASAAPAGWQNLNFDHSTWPEGPAQLGFSNNEENDEATLIADNDQITSYFRRGFSVGDSNAFTGLSLWMLRDDAGVVYLNGTEIYRSPNLPAPPAIISYTTTSGTPNGENTIDTATTNRNALRTGTNVLAVEIHQQSATSSDVSFDFELIGIGAPPTVAQSVYLGTFDGKFTVAWGDAALLLETTADLQGASTVWTPVGLGSPALITPEPGTPQRFYRLRK